MGKLRKNANEIKINANEEEKEINYNKLEKEINETKLFGNNIIDKNFLSLNQWKIVCHLWPMMTFKIMSAVFVCIHD